MTNRRGFLSGCSTLALAATLSPGTLSAASVFSLEPVSARLSYESFAKCLGSSFILQRDSGANVGLELTQVVPQQPSPFDSPNAPDARHEKFSLMFRGPHSAALAQDTYTFEHRQIGRFEMFIVPVRVKDETHGYYEAIFNRDAGGPFEA